jgi:YrbI family 3-deoxy-D-manno-octulosonate 8-phosphate phosphatase
MTYRALISDVDGVLTNGLVHIGEDGKEKIKTFHVRDGLAIARMAVSGSLFAVITGRSSQPLIQRMKELGVKHCYHGRKDKPAALCEYMKEYDLSLSELIYVGDDLNDLEIMRLIKNGGGLCLCPADAAQAVKDEVDIVLSTAGGYGVVREIVEKYFPLVLEL